MVGAGAVERVNALGACWGRELGFGGGQVWTALGVWPLLAMLAAGANGPARAELERALGVPAEQAPAVARELLAQVRAVPGCAAALGLWTADGVAVEPGWVAELGAPLWGRLSGDPFEDRAVLDRWAREWTGGLVPRMPVDPAGALLVLASAVAVRTRWLRPFQEGRFQVLEGPWAGRDFAQLSVSGPELFERIAVAESSAGRVTEVRVAGTGEVDVHLVLGEPGAAPGAVVAAGFELVAGAARRTPVAGLPDGVQGPGLQLSTVDSPVPQHLGALNTAAFRVRAEHDLLVAARLFGLGTAAQDGDHFRGISRSTPLKVARAQQAATAEFSAQGFEAGAVTAVVMAPGSAMFAPLQQYRIRVAAARFDRPFAFLALHRPTGLVLMAGWVAEPARA
ncbi:serine protease inhibitor [Kitasatospora cineracea]|uniref:Serine protease inhibitor n=1 Tax=Kitasatospora cineracea TaxID=88074 RepID=A0A8G1UJV7_9ACTN|nr:serine protease inhibitor [Kitasatospora cineracea]